MTTSYLILHKVRGEAALDIAEEIAPDTWIIPTSGHRAYPFLRWLVADLLDTSDINQYGHHNRPWDWLEKNIVPLDWPDHYAVNDRKCKIERAILDTATIMADLDLKAEDLNAALATVLKQRKE